MKKYIILTVMFTALFSAVFSQAFKSGEKAEALINGAWKEVTILKLVSGKKDVYEVQAITATGKSTSVIATYQVKEENLRSLNKTKTVTASTPAVTATPVVKEVPSAILGKYSIYSGIQNIYIGRFELLDGSNYKVALASDEDSYATGTYTYDAASNTIEWKTGFFWQKKWAGKLTGSRIQFSAGTYGDRK